MSTPIILDRCDSKSVIVALTYRCNLGCVYCQNKHTAHLFSQEMPLDGFQYVLRWVQGQGMHIYLYGGEPTAHSRFEEILDLCESHGVRFVLATNNLFTQSLWRRLSHYAFPNKNVINYNLPRDYSPEQLNVFHRNLEQAREGGIPFYFWFCVQPDDDIREYEYILRDVVKYQVDLGVCLATPHGKRVKDYLGKLFHLVRLCKHAKQNVFLARPLPSCLVPSEFEHDEAFMDIYYQKSLCSVGPVVINPDLTVFPCPAINRAEFLGPTLKSFNSAQDIWKYYAERVCDLANIPLDNECRSCDRFDDGSCQGGCLVNRLST